MSSARPNWGDLVSSTLPNSSASSLAPSSHLSNPSPPSIIEPPSSDAPLSPLVATEVANNGVSSLPAAVSPLQPSSQQQQQRQPERVEATSSFASATSTSVVTPSPAASTSTATALNINVGTLSHQLAHSQLKSAAVDEDDPLPLATHSGLHPNDRTAQVTVIPQPGASTARAGEPGQESSSSQNQEIYQSAESFETLRLSPELLKGIYEMKFSVPSKIQAQALPIIMSPPYPNLIGQAHHGSGKTATFSLGILSRVQADLKEPQAIVVVPTRELAIQVSNVMKSLAKFTALQIFTAIPIARDTEQDPNEQRGPVCAQVVVGTPGKLESKIKHGDIATGRVKIFVADEADQMISADGMVEQTMKIKAKMPKNTQVLLFSATFDQKTRMFAKTFAPKATEIAVKTEELSLDSIKQFFVDCKREEDKYAVLTSMYALLEIGQSIIFVHTVATAKFLANRMRQDGYTVSLLHGKDMQPEERDRIMLDFREQRATVLITTNVLARGIDVLSVTLVINYDIPLDRHNSADTETYIHRIGRSGRFGRRGVAINLVATEKSKLDLDKIKRHFGVQITELPKDDKEKCAEIVQAALSTISGKS